MWRHISSLSVYTFTNTASRMLNMFCIKGVHTCKKTAHQPKKNKKKQYKINEQFLNSVTRGLYFEDSL